MKLTYAQLETHLSKKLASIYIIGGEDVFLKQDALNLIRKTAKQTGFSERVKIKPDTNSDWDELYQSLYAKSLLAEKRIIELNCTDVTPNKSASSILQEYAHNPVLDNVLLMELGKIDDKIAKSAWYKALETAGMVITIWPIPREQLPQWILNRAKKYKLSLLTDAANLLADYVEGNVGAAAQAIEKIYLLRPQTEVDAELINTILLDESRFSIFDFIEHLISGDKQRALHILSSLKMDGAEPILILWGIARELRLLADLAQQLKTGATYEKLFQTYRIFFKRQHAVRNFLSKHSAQHCWDYLAQLTEIDRVIKGAIPGDSWTQLQLFCLRISL